MSSPHRPVSRMVSVSNAGLFFLAGLMGLCFIATAFRYSGFGVGVVVGASGLVTAPRLAWTMPWWSTVLAALLVVGVLVTIRRPSSAVRVPIALPLGLVILMCLLGWGRSEGLSRCDDYLRAQRQPGVEILFPTVDQL